MIRNKYNISSALKIDGIWKINPAYQRLWRRDDYKINSEKYKTSSKKYLQKHSEENRKKACKWAKDNPKKANIKTKRWADANKEKIQAKRRRQRYGLLQFEFDLMMKNQGNKCALCYEEFGLIYSQRPTVDHDHKTNKVRGILCDRCNRLLGGVNDDIKLLELAIEYLKRFQ